MSSSTKPAPQNKLSSKSSQIPSQLVSESKLRTDSKASKDILTIDNSISNKVSEITSKPDLPLDPPKKRKQADFPMLKSSVTFMKKQPKVEDMLKLSKRNKSQI